MTEYQDQRLVDYRSLDRAPTTALISVADRGYAFVPGSTSSSLVEV
ncbi:hypothetical protein ACVIGB_008579 [Bradyrhizobium sp. USDA 4341]